MKKIIGVTIVALFLFIMLGCAQNQANDTNSENNNLVKVNQPGETNNKQMNGEEVAEHLVELTTSVPNVKDATAVVVGNYAVVGIDVEDDLDRSRVGSIKYSVAEILQHDPHGANAVVVADPDAVTRLKEMNKQIKDGHPVEGIMEELAGLIGRIIPQVPADIDTNEKPTNQNDQQLENKEQKELDQIQDKQSNSNM
ncbi:YhcN/YlaJ family sporulation lipoprotein [Bacillus sp. Marseille-P3661]|uniref:YhcN/YlaJ family sporulation lipoprotein n=1 Tax=Bacillus sp. Marseille-P3661 TaxID=1936234 RepID=UPI000C81CCBA|nr:YhcN/YlaJ family sporulation lipoprotein [Bacillus sp. Marseille-P3661]